MTATKAIVAGAIATLTALGAPSVDGAFHWWQIPAALAAGLLTGSGVYFAPKNTPS